MESGWEVDYYLKQAGSGFSPFSGIRYQRGNGFSPYKGLRYQKGNGFLGRIWKGVTLPLLKYIGKHGLEAAGNIISEINSDPGDVRNIVKKEAKRIAGQAVEDGGKRLSTFIQTGKGLKTRIAPRGSKMSEIKKKTRKTIKEGRNNTSKRISKHKETTVKKASTVKSNKRVIKKAQSTKQSKCRVKKSFLSLN